MKNKKSNVYLKVLKSGIYLYEIIVTMAGIKILELTNLSKPELNESLKKIENSLSDYNIIKHNTKLNFVIKK